MKILLYCIFFVNNYYMYVWQKFIFNETNFFRLNKAFEKLNQIFKELKNKSGLTDNSSIEEIYEKFDINLMEDILWSV